MWSSAGVEQGRGREWAVLCRLEGKIGKGLAQEGCRISRGRFCLILTPILGLQAVHGSSQTGTSELAGVHPSSPVDPVGP